MQITDGWVWRSLLLVAAGSILAFAVDVHIRHIDIYRVGLILIASGVLDLLLNVAVGGYYRRRPVPVSARPVAPPRI